MLKLELKVCARPRDVCRRVMLRRLALAVLLGSSAATVVAEPTKAPEIKVSLGSVAVEGVCATSPTTDSQRSAMQPAARGGSAYGQMQWASGKAKIDATLRPKSRLADRQSLKLVGECAATVRERVPAGQLAQITLQSEDAVTAAINQCLAERGAAVQIRSTILRRGLPVCN